MPGHPEELTARLDALEAKLEVALRRLDRLEGARADHLSSLPDAPDEPTPSLPTMPSSLPALGGRVLLAVAGGYFIRALTEAGVLPATAGVLLGLGYSLAWLVLADRASRGDGDRAAAGFHGLASVLLAYPLIWESAARFGALSPWWAATAVAVVTASQLAVAGRRRLGALAWMALVSSLATTVSLLVATHDLLASTFTLLATATLVEGMATAGLWPSLRLPVAVVLDAVLLLMIGLLRREGGVPANYPPVPMAGAMAILLLTPLVYVSGAVYRTLRRDRPVSTLGALLSSAALAIGLGGAWALLVMQQRSPAPLGMATLLFAMLCYGAAFAFVERRGGRSRNFHFYATAGGVLMAAATVLLASGSWLATWWCGLSLLAGVVGRRFRRTTLRYHAAAFLTAAVVQSGAATGAGTALAGSDEVRFGALALVLLCCLGCLALLANTGHGLGVGQRLPQVVAAGFAVWILAGLTAGVLGAALAPLAGDNPGVDAATATGVVAGLALSLAAARRHVRELGWLVYPLLAVGGLKLLIHDLPQGSPGTMVASLLLYSAALTGAPRLLRDRGESLRRL